MKPIRTRLEVFAQLLSSVAEEMGAALGRASFSPNIRERRDFSCSLHDAEGRTLSQAAHIPVHLGSMSACVQSAMREVPMGPRDAVILNDPYRGGTHLPDVTLVTPVFLGRKRRPDFYCANRAHHADIGGAHPGSMAPARDIHGEGLRIPPVRWVRGGVVDRELTTLLLANMRVPREREGDLLAQWSANQIGAERLAELAREHGAREIARAGSELIGWSAALARAWVGTLPRRGARFADVLESSSGGTLAVRLALARRKQALELDFRACDDATAEPLNTPRAVLVSAALYAVRLFLPPYAPANDGILDALAILTRPGSLVDARYPAPVAAGNVETSQRLVDVILGALAELLPDCVPAASAGTMSNLSFGGRRGEALRSENGEDFTYYETIAGGAGGSAQGAGASALHTHMTNTRNTPIEALENALPVRVLELAIRPRSGGEGVHRGGDGIRKCLRFLAPVDVGWMADRSLCGPWGLGGGGRGLAGSARVRLAGAAPETLPSKSARSLPAGAEFEIETPGGGGWSHT